MLLTASSVALYSRRSLGLAMAVALLLPTLSGCGDDLDIETAYPSDDSSTHGSHPNRPGIASSGSLFGDGGIVLLGEPDYRPDDGGGGAGIGVNSFLWRASIDTLAFLPLTSADPFGGVIITDWYTPPQTPNERFKISAFILDRAMRADGVRVAVFRQEQGANGWVDAAVADSMSTDLENAILRRARLLRIRTLANQE